MKKYILIICLLTLGALNAVAQVNSNDYCGKITKLWPQLNGNFGKADYINVGIYNQSLNIERRYSVRQIMVSNEVGTLNDAWTRDTASDWLNLIINFSQNKQTAYSISSGRSVCVSKNQAGYILKL